MPITEYGCRYTCTNSIARAQMYKNGLKLLLILKIIVFPRSVLMTSDVSSGECGPYNGKICKNYLDTHSVWYNLTENNFGGFINEQITTNLWNEMIVALSEPCKLAAQKLLCAYAFPQCLMKNMNPVRLPLCYEDCIAVKLQFCYNEWALIEDNKVRNIFITNRGHFLLPNCDILPRISTNKTITCTHAHLTDIQLDQVTYNCVNSADKGRYYQGKINVSKYGLNCQKWTSQSPHTHIQPPHVFPELEDSENFCRNAGGVEPHPWCYTVDKDVRWQYCDIPLCNHSIHFGAKNNVKKSEILMDTLLSPTYITIISTIGFLILLVLFLIMLWWHKSTGKKNCQNNNSTNFPSNNYNIDLDKLTSNACYHRTDVLNPQLEKLEFSRNNILYLRDLGQGAFGRVFHAKAPGIISSQEFTDVAVKVLKDEASSDLQMDFEREACLLSKFDHPNIVKLLGICAIGKPTCLIFEYMEKGDLNEFLRYSYALNYFGKTNYNEGPLLERPNENLQLIDEKIGSLLSTKDLLSLGKQISAGMVYLSSHKFVHRDLATRNCLVGSNMIVKIADFGLSQKIDIQDYYKGDERDAIPVRWMPLESILYNKYTVETDVWAYGVCLWEIFSFALQPYYGMTHEEVVKYIKQGNRLSCPNNTPYLVYKLMCQCWEQKPSLRPTFETIYRNLDSIYLKLS